MLRDLFKIKIVMELDKRIMKNVNKFDNKDTYVLDIINKSNLTINDINYLLGENNCLDIDKIIDEVLSNKINNNFIKYLVYKFIIINSNDREVINFILAKLGYKYNLDDVNLLDNYMIDKSFSNNDKVFLIIDKVWKYEKNEEYTLFKDNIKKLYKFKLMIDSGMFPDTLIDSFIKIKKYKNLYYQLSKLEKGLVTARISDSDKLFILWTYNYIIDDELMFKFSNVNIEIDDLIKFIKGLEEKKFILSEERLNNLLNNFKNYYYEKRNCAVSCEELSKKVIVEYSKYYDNNYYFKNQDFVDYYNHKYKDNFSGFIFGDNKEIKLNLDIFNSIFLNDKVIGNYFLYKDYVGELKSFKEIKKDSYSYLEEQELYYKEKRKFYKKYMCKINDFVNNYDICLKHFMLRKIPKDVI